MNRSFFLTASICCVLFAMLTPVLRADTLIVTNTADGVADEGTLRQAIDSANSGDTITFDVPLPATITVQEGPISISGDVVIVGPGADKLTISGDGTNRIFFTDATISISDVTFSNGVTSSDPIGFPFEGGGGAIFNWGDLTISRCTFKNNVFTGGAGHGVGGGGGAGGGGAIFNDFGLLVIVDSTLNDNLATGGAGHRTGGGGGGGFGGAILNWSNMILSNCTVSGNRAVGGSAGVADDGDSTGDGGNGLGYSDAGAGGYQFHDGSSGGDGSTGGGGGGAADAQQLTGICDGDTGGDGGEGSTYGGGGGAGGRGADGCIVEVPGDGGNGGNSGFGGDGGFGGGGGGAGQGGLPTGVGTLPGVEGTPGTGGFGAASGVSTNGGAGAGIGGAIFNLFSSLSIINCTITSNSVAGGTSTDHVADSTGITGGVFNRGGNLDVMNTIIAGNQADLAPDVAYDTDDGTDLFSNGNNLIGIGDGSSAFINGTNGDLVGSTNALLDAKLGPLADNGGPTYTHALLTGSPAIDAGSEGDCSATDQRGAARPSGLRCDIGAFELDNPPEAICRNVTVTLVSGCTTNVSIDNGSSDPDLGDSITLSQSPAGPYSVGTNLVTLTVTDSLGATDSCTATVIVLDNIAPTITCPSNKTAQATLPAGAVVTFADPVTSDNCSTTVSCVPPSGSTFPIGDTTVHCTATDTAGNTDSCTFTMHVKNASEQLADTEQVILGLGIDARIKKSVLKKVQKIEKQINTDHTRSACKQLQKLLRKVQQDLFKERLTNDQAIQITTPLVRALTVLNCS